MSGTTDALVSGISWVDLAAEIRVRPRRAFRDCEELLEFHKAWGDAVTQQEIELEAEETEESTIVSSAGAG